MKTSACIDASSRKGERQKSPVSLKAREDKVKDPMVFLKTCAREEGIYFNDSIWTRIEEIVAFYAR